MTRSSGMAGRAGWILVPLVWIVAALLPTKIRGVAWAKIGVTLARPRRSLRLFAWTSLVVLPLLFCGVLLWARLGFPLPLRPAPAGRRWVSWIIYQLFYVSIAEELFFRGYVQSNLTRGLALVAPKFLRFCGGAGVALSSALFALAHVAVLGAATAGLAFFPGLLFGWLRARTGSLLAPVLFHATANIGYAVACAVL